MNFKKLSTLFPMALLLMGNESCEQQQNRETGRQLKKLVELGRITTPPLSFPNGSNFDFGFVANQQMAGVLFASDGFAFKVEPPMVVTPQGMNFNLSSADSSMIQKLSMKGQDPMVHWSTEASCMVNIPMARLYGSINSFEMVNSGGITLGFNANGSYNGAGLGGSLDFEMESLQLDASMDARRPFTNKIMAAANINSKQTKTKVAFTINLGMFSLGPKYYHQTPLSAVTKKALTIGVTSLKEQLKSEEWYTRVLVNHDTHLTVIGGQDVGLEKGDILAVYNEIYYWDGEPCASSYRGGVATEPIAIIEIASVGDEVSYGKFIQQKDENAVIGAKVKLLKFHD
jgi:hypothetical protein